MHLNYVITNRNLRRNGKQVNPFGLGGTTKKSMWRRLHCNIMKSKDSKGNVDHTYIVVFLFHLTCVHCLRFHSEGRVVHMIFGLLFWDIIFASIPGAFETPYQSAPLDIADCFYQSRESEIETRLSDICAGRGAEILEDVFNENEPKGTWCIGVRWDTFEIQDLVEIVKVKVIFARGSHQTSDNLSTVLGWTRPVSNLSAALRRLRRSQQWCTRSSRLERPDRRL